LATLNLDNLVDLRQCTSPARLPASLHQAGCIAVPL